MGKRSWILCGRGLLKENAEKEKGSVRKHREESGLGIHAQGQSFWMDRKISTPSGVRAKPSTRLRESHPRAERTVRNSHSGQRFTLWKAILLRPEMLDHAGCIFGMPASTVNLALEAVLPPGLRTSSITLKSAV